MAGRGRPSPNPRRWSPDSYKKHKLLTSASDENYSNTKSNTSNNSLIMVLAIVIIARIVMMSASDNKNHNCHKLRVGVEKYQLSKNISNSHNHSHGSNSNRIM